MLEICKKYQFTWLFAFHSIACHFYSVKFENTDVNTDITTQYLYKDSFRALNTTETFHFISHLADFHLCNYIFLLLYFSCLSNFLIFIGLWIEIWLTSMRDSVPIPFGMLTILLLWSFSIARCRIKHVLNNSSEINIILY